MKAITKYQDCQLINTNILLQYTKNMRFTSMQNLDIHLEKLCVEN